MLNSRVPLELLLSQQLRWPLIKPAPTTDELIRVIDVALRASDHGELRPWRFVLIHGKARRARFCVGGQGARSTGRCQAIPRQGHGGAAVDRTGRICGPATMRSKGEQILAAATTAINMSYTLPF